MLASMWQRPSWMLPSAPSGDRWQISRDQAGFRQLIPRLRALEPVMVLLEASGGLELPLVAALAAEAVPVVVVNPRQVRDFAKATGRLAKTDTLDAAVLAHFAEVVRPPVRPYGTPKPRSWPLWLPADTR